MRKVIAIGIILVLLLLLLPSCAAGVSGLSQEDYDKIVNDLAAIQTQIQSLQDDLTTTQAQIQSLQDDLAKVQPQIQPLPEEKEVAGEKLAEALAYAEYLDILMYPLWKEAKLTPRFDFEDELEWLIEIKNRTDNMGDAKLGDYFEALKGGDEAAMNLIWRHCFDIIEKALK